MKLTKALQAEILSIYNAYWDAYLRGDMKAFASMLDENISVFGSAAGEVFGNKRDAVRFYTATADQMTDKAEFRHRKISMQPAGNVVLIREQSNLYVIAGKKWTLYGHVRISAVLQHGASGWRVVHQHASFPDARAGEGEQLAAEQINKENLQLREAVQRRTSELEASKRELEIEAALERVRAVAMGMRRPDDMLDICRVISDELASLGVKDVRNVQTAIFYPQRTTYMNYEYYTKHKRTFITEVTYNNNKVHNAFAMKMLKGEGEFYTTHIKGKKVKQWIAYQKTTNVFIDRYLHTASSLSYYWYSLSPVAMGISSYTPLTDEDLELFKRFKNVFELAYQRYLDIEQALVQAQEAKIEASLEKVRAQAMSMRTTQELKGVGKVIFAELKSLGLTDLRNTEILINNDTKESVLSHYYSDYGVSGTIEVFYNDHPLVRKWAHDMKKASDAFAEIVISEREMKAWRRYREEIGYLPDPKLNRAKALYYYSYSTGLGALSVSSFAPITVEQLKILERFRNVFTLAYRRYADVAQAEAQAKEATIEASLEKVRAVAMGMHTSAELLNVCETLFTELGRLGFDELRNAMINIHNDEKKSFINYDYSDEIGRSTNHLVYDIHPLVEKQIRTIRSADDAFSETYFTGKDLVTWKNFRRTIGEKDDPRLDKNKGLYYYFYSIGIGSIGISTFGPITEEKRSLLKRFRNVFALSYQRYADIAKAEAQAREAHIEMCLERVRARAMAMHHTSELQDVINTVHQQFKALNIAATGGAFVAINDDNTRELTIWGAGGVTEYAERVRFPFFDRPIYTGLLAGMKNGSGLFTEEFSHEEKIEFFNHLFQVPPFRNASPERKNELLSRPGGYTRSCYVSHYTTVFVINHHGERFSEEENRILMRFGNVFEQTYTRFLDLQKAEAQTREAEIQLALERVRARSLAMHHTSELQDVVNIVAQQLCTMGMDISGGVIITINNEVDDDLPFWASSGAAEYVHKVVAPCWDRPIFTDLRDAIKKRNTVFAGEYSREEKNEFLRHLFGYAPWNSVPEGRKEQLLSREGGLARLAAISHHTTVAITNHYGTKYSDKESDILQRFGNVFEQSYIRFLDLQKAEAQAREAEIELALERVRARTMAMQKSDELKEAASILYRELMLLHIGNLFNCGYVLVDEANDLQHGWMTYSDGRIREAHTMPLQGDRIMNERYEQWKKGTRLFSQKVGGNKLKTHLEFVSGRTDAAAVTESVLPQLPDPVFFYCGNFSNGYLHVISREELSKEAESVLSRFTAVFEQTYTRFVDLQKAEAQAREMQIEASLERVRSRTLAMQKSDELAETAAVLFRQLITLGIAPNRLYIAVLQDDSGNAEFWITDEDGSKVTSGFDANLLANPSFMKMYAGWKEGAKSLTIDMQGEELQEYFRHLSSLNVPFKGGLSQQRRVQTIAYFSKGFIGMASPDEQPEEAATLLERFAAVFNLTLTRFNDLKLAEAQAYQAQLDLIQLQAEKKRAEDALAELNATQAQLVQQEKLASLGQLTAGIAHEIKNPLNFVNNFSAVSAELIDETIEEVKRVAPDLQNGEIGQLLQDVKANLTRIVEHGTRADGIVKSMLQHSRGGSGKKEPTDLNALVKEYANLAFHGMRASKSPITVEIAFALDPSVCPLPLITEDFSRVIVNLCQNAFDAMREKLNAGNSAYHPTLTVHTRREPHMVILEIEDNGPGIPDAIKDKILQPFFTTKKGTQGTGLGLSITHDIVKAHGGELRIETNGNGGATFIITLPQGSPSSSAA